MKIAFWGEESGCGTTSSMAAVASVCSGMWNLKTVLVQSRNQKADLCTKLEQGRQSAPKQEAGLVTVRKGRMYYMLQEEYRKQERYTGFFVESMWKLIHRAEQFSDIVFIDCGFGEDELSKDIVSKSDAAVMNLIQKRQSLDQYFQKRHIFSGNVIYLVNQYDQESAYNRQNLNRLYRIQKEELSLIPDNQFFRYASDNGKTERFVRKYMHYMNRDRQFYFMQELMHAAGMILNAAGYVKSGK